MTFDTIGTGDTVSEAFGRAQDDAAWEHGHGGYTGTIAEKGGYVLIRGTYSLTDARLLADAMVEYDKATVREITGAEDHEAQLWISVYDDKWGPCIAMSLDNGAWYFCGWASC